MVREDTETIIRQKLLEREWAACKTPRYWRILRIR